MALILASASPRRLELLKQIGIIPDKVSPADIDESSIKGELPIAYSKRIAIGKARVVRKAYPNDYILSADTTVVLGRRILQKAETPFEAREFLNLLSGRRHKVLTAIAIITPDGKEVIKLVTSIVQFKCLSEEDKDEYIASNEWKDKAGGYAIQGLAAKYISFQSGSFSNIVGLPLYETANLLQGVGLR